MTTQTNLENAPILVVGGQGKTGRRVAELLANKGMAVRAVSRASEPAFDWTQPETWPAALAGASAAYVTYYPDLALPGAAETVEAFAKVAIAAGVERLVLLSGRGEPGAEHAERLLTAVAPRATVLRANWFNQNFSESYMAEGVLAGELVLPAGDTREPFVDAGDIAEVAAAVLTEPGHEGKLYELSGPEAVTFAEAVEIIAKAAGRPVAYVPVPLGDYLAELVRAEQPPEVIELLRILFGEVFDGRNSEPRDGVAQVLGRPATSLADYAARTAASGAWR